MRRNDIERGEVGDGRKGVWLIKTYLDVSIAQLNGLFKGRMLGYKFSRHNNGVVIKMAVQRKGRCEECKVEARDVNVPPFFMC